VHALHRLFGLDAEAPEQPAAAEVTELEARRQRRSTAAGK
jgi:hypothetical protein